MTEYVNVKNHSLFSDRLATIKREENNKTISALTGDARVNIVFLSCRPDNVEVVFEFDLPVMDAAKYFSCQSGIVGRHV